MCLNQADHVCKPRLLLVLGGVALYDLPRCPSWSASATYDLPGLPLMICVFFSKKASFCRRQMSLENGSGGGGPLWSTSTWGGYLLRSANLFLGGGPLWSTTFLVCFHFFPCLFSLFVLFGCLSCLSSSSSSSLSSCSLPFFLCFSLFLPLLLWLWSKKGREEWKIKERKED